MTIAKIRNLSEKGVITDIDPFNIPTNAWSMAVNARFKGGSVVRAPVFRRAPRTLSQASPRFLTSSLPASGFSTLYIGYLNGRVSSYVSGVETDLSIAAFSPNNAEGTGFNYTSCILENVLYINRADRTPWYLRNTDIAFQDLSAPTPVWSNITTYAIGNLVTGSDGFTYSSVSNSNTNHNPVGDGGVNWTKTGKPWDTTWRANLLRQCAGALVALGITKGATVFPTMYKTSEFAQINSPPSTWDSNDPTNNATENSIGGLQGNIIEAQNLGSQLYIYGLNQTYVLTADGSAEVFNVQEAFNDRGCINANCVVEIDRKHFVFGLNDIWVHDGTSKQSICDLITHDFIFGSMNLSKAFRFFVQHDVNRKELRFCYISGDAFTAFASGSGGCNRCAIYNLIEKTWTFDDLPYVFSATMSNTDTTLTYHAACDTTSSTSVLIGTGSKTFTVSVGLGFVSSDSIVISSAANSHNAMLGTVSSYSGTTLTVNVTSTTGSGTFSDWEITDQAFIYSTIGGAYLDQDDSTKRNLIMTGDVSATYGLLESIYALDNQGPGSNVAFPVDTNATRPVTLIKDGIDLDELPEVQNNAGYKVVSTIYPQARFETGAQPLQFQFASADQYNDTFVYNDPQTFDGSVDVRCDFDSAGRFLAMKITHNDYHYFDFTGIDIDVYSTGQV
jgi:hypothetical protein